MAMRALMRGLNTADAGGHGFPMGNGKPDNNRLAATAGRPFVRNSHVRAR